MICHPCLANGDPADMNDGYRDDPSLKETGESI